MVATQGTHLDIPHAPLLTRLLVTEMATNATVFEGPQPLYKQLVNRVFSPTPKLMMIDPQCGLRIGMSARITLNDVLSHLGVVTSSDWREFVTQKLAFGSCPTWTRYVAV
jgi:hypothetical protein